MTLPSYRIRPTYLGDTLQDIALRELGTADRWPELAALNNLTPPYLVDNLSDLEDDGTDGAARVLLAGAPIKVPAPPAKPTGVGDRNDLFGTDLDLGGGRLHDNGAGDLLLISDYRNLTQAVRHRLDTHLRELTRHPQYGNGVHRLRGRGAEPMTKALAAAYTDRAIRSDPRISTTQGTVAEVIGDLIPVTTTAIAIDGKHLPVGGDL